MTRDYSLQPFHFTYKEIKVQVDFKKLAHCSVGLYYRNNIEEVSGERRIGELGGEISEPIKPFHKIN